MSRKSLACFGLRAFALLIQNQAKKRSTQLRRWGYSKNIDRGQASTISREKDRRKAEGKDFDFTMQSHPILGSESLLR